MTQELSEEFLRRIQTVTSKRPRTVIEHILKHGYITTEELKELYGYNHPPRAARDVREQGIPLDTFRMTASDGRSIAAYKFADETKIRADILAGRKVFSKEFKRQLVEKNGSICAIHLERLEDRYLQVDHRVPYEVAGDPVGQERRLEDYMLLCGSANRAKSWSCEHCVNWLELKLETICQTCYWAYPENYTHIAMQPIRRVDLTWVNQEVEIYERLKAQALQAQQELPEYIKDILAKHSTEK